MGLPKIGLPEMGFPEVGLPKIGLPEMGFPEVGFPLLLSPCRNYLHRNDDGEERGHRALGSSTAQGWDVTAKFAAPSAGRVKELRKDERQNGMKTGEVFSSCLMAEQTSFWDVQSISCTNSS